MNPYTNYDEIGLAYSNEKRRSHRDRPDEVAVFVEEILSGSCCDLLDLGCGSGEDLHVLKALGLKRVRGIDESRVMVDLARKLLGDDMEILQGCASDLPYQDGDFDVVFSRFVLQYIDDTDQVYNEIWRCMRPYGLFISVIPHPCFFYFHLRSADQGKLSVHPFSNDLQVCYPFRKLDHFLSRNFFEKFKVTQIKELFLDPDLPMPSGLAMVSQKI